MSVSSQRELQKDRSENFLRSYDNTVQRSMSRSHSEILFGCHLRSVFDQFKPYIFWNMVKTQQYQKYKHDRVVNAKTFEQDKPV